MAERADSQESQDVSDQVSGQKAKHCQPCTKKNKFQKATVFCKDCKQFQCNECSKTHEIFDFMSGHEIVTAEEGSSLKPAFDMKGLDKCKNHGKTLEFYCVSERKLCCSTCAIAGHRGCPEVDEISSQAKKQSINFSGVESTIQELLDTTNDLTKMFEKNTVSGKLEAALDYIDGIKKTLVNKFDQLKEALTKQFQSAKEQLMELMNTSMTATEGIFNDLREKKELLMSAKTLGTLEQKFIASNIIQDQITPFKKTLQGKRASLYTLDCSFECSKQLTELLDEKFSLATLIVEKIPTPVQLKLFTSMDFKKGEQDIDEPLYTMDFFPDGRLALVDSWNKKLCIMGENLERKGMFNFSGHRYGVCVVSEEEVAVTSGGHHLVEFLHVSKTNKITMTRTVETTTDYFSICLMNETTFLVSTIDDKRPLRMITLTGVEKDFDNIPEKQYKLDDSQITYIRHKDIAVITDRLEHTVHMYEVGEKGLPIRVVKHDDIKEPRGVCVGPDGCLFVCCCSTHSIVQVSPSGKVVATLKLDMEYPYTVCVSKDGRWLAVTNNIVGDRKVQLFFIHI